MQAEEDGWKLGHARAIHSHRRPLPGPLIPLGHLGADPNRIRWISRRTRGLSTPWQNTGLVYVFTYFFTSFFSRTISSKIAYLLCFQLEKFQSSVSVFHNLSKNEKFDQLPSIKKQKTVINPEMRQLVIPRVIFLWILAFMTFI